MFMFIFEVRLNF